MTERATSITTPSVRLSSLCVAATLTQLYITSHACSNPEKTLYLSRDAWLCSRPRILDWPTTVCCHWRPLRSLPPRRLGCPKHVSTLRMLQSHYHCQKRARGRIEV